MDMVSEQAKLLTNPMVEEIHAQSVGKGNTKALEQSAGLDEWCVSRKLDVGMILQPITRIQSVLWC